MRKRVSKNNFHSSLFPFLSVLTCTIGALALLIVVLAYGQAEPVKEQDAIKYQALLKEINELRELLKDSQFVNEEIALNDNTELPELDELEKDYGYWTKVKERQTYDELLEEKNFWKKIEEAEKLSLKLQKNKEKAESLKSEVEKLKRKLEETQKQFTILPSTGSGEGLKPVFVECMPEGVIIHDKPGITSIEVKSGDIENSGEYQKVLQKVNESLDSTLIFLIRPGSVKTYYKANSIAKERKVRCGKIPLPSLKQIDFGIFGSPK